MRLTFLLAVLLTLPACGADAPPLPPERDSGITITGDAQFGVSGTLD